MTTTAGPKLGLHSGLTCQAEIAQSTATVYVKMYCILVQHNIIHPSYTLYSILSSAHADIFFFQSGDDFYCSVDDVRYRYDNDQVFTPTGEVLSFDLN